MLTDPIADMLTRIRNANRIERPVVDIPLTRQKTNIAAVLKDEGFIVDYQVGVLRKDDSGFESFQPLPGASGAKAILRLFLKYGPEGERVIRYIQRASRPGRRLYRRAGELPPVLDGLGIAILSTSQGIMSDRQARAKRVGGELLATIW
jgi:small subunit ribosomal protein S8